MTTTPRDDLIDRLIALAATCAAAATVTHGTAAQLEAALSATLEGRLTEAQAAVARLEATVAGTVAA